MCVCVCVCAFLRDMFRIAVHLPCVTPLCNSVLFFCGVLRDASRVLAFVGRHSTCFTSGLISVGLPRLSARATWPFYGLASEGNPSECRRRTTTFV